MAHSDKLIHTITLPDGSNYEVHDAQAIHTLADLAALGFDTEGIFVFKGTVAAVANLPTTNNKVGDVYHVTANHSEYVWAKVDGATAGSWEEFGEHFVINHTHEVTITGTNEASAVSGTATVTGGNSTSSVSGSASIEDVPKVSASAKYAKVSTGNDTFVKSYPGATSKMVTTSIKPAGTAVAVINSVSPTSGSITGVSGSTTASKATAGSNITVATRASSQTTVGNANVGSATTVATGLKGGSVVAGSTATWSAKVEEGVLSFTFTPNTPTAVTLPTATTTSITPAAASTTKIYGVGGTKSITPYTFEDITVPVADTNATSIITDISTDTANVATVGSEITVATGSLASTGAGSVVMTGLGTATTASALTSATLATGTSTDGIHTGDDVTVETQTLTGTISGTAAAQTWTQNTGSISGTAAAQKWTQASGSTGTPKE